MKLSDFAPQFLDWVNKTHSIEPRTQDYYHGGVKMLLRTHLSEISLEKISNHLCETCCFPGGNGNANTALRTLRRMLHKAQEMGVITFVPKIKMRKEWPRSIAMSSADAVLIASHMRGAPKDAFGILRATGMRPKECFSLRWEFVDFSRAIYQNPKGKTASARRSIPLLFESFGVLRRRHEEANCPKQGWVFPTFSCSGHLNSIQKPYTEARKKAGLPDKMVLYAARHGFATDAAPLISLKGLMDIMGHSSPTTALRYQHPTVEDLVAKLTQIRSAPMV